MTLTPTVIKGPAAEVLTSRLAELRPVAADAQRSGLDRRVDVKYAVDADSLDAVLRSLARDHDLLSENGLALNRCERVYFDTPDLRSFHEHVAGVRPRFKARLARNLDTGESVFELKLKLPDGSTDRRRSPQAHGIDADLVPDAQAFVAAAMAEAGLEPPASLAPTLVTHFSRARLFARGTNAGITIDVGVRLQTADGRQAVELRDDFAIVETKSRNGASAADRALGDRQVQETPLSKYRTGIDALVEPEPGDALAAARALFRSA